jgi:hypothetical protein
MSYSIDKYNGTTIAVVEDGTIDSTLDIKLIGKNYAGYGEVQNENFVHLLENFAGSASPPRPITGQIWYDISTKKIKFYDASSARWRTAGGAESASGPTGPVGLGQGDFWWETNNKQLYVYDGTSYVLVGPQGVAGLGTTQMKSVSVTDNATGASHAIVQGITNGEVMMIISADQFTLSLASAIPGFGTIKEGITLVNTDNSDGITDIGSGRIIWGTTSNALKLAGRGIDDFVLVSPGGIEFSSIVSFVDEGWTLGDDNDLAVFIDPTDSITPIVKTLNNDTIKFQTYNSGAPTEPHKPMTLQGPHILPGNDVTTDLGASLTKFRNVYATSFLGTASSSNRLKIDDSASDVTWNSLDQTTWYRSAKTTAGAYTIAARDSLGKITAAEFLGNATSATTATTATRSNSFEVGPGSGVYRTAAVDSLGVGTANTIACRDIDGNLNAVLFQGTATSALFADLAEKYLADDEYEIGTVVVVGGEAEVTACQLGERAFGAVSGSPAYMMNAGLEGGTYIALKGRVPVKVLGPVRKGDKLIAAGNGCAGSAHVILKNMAIRAGSFPDTFAIALENSDDDGIKLVEAIIL